MTSPKIQRRRSLGLESLEERTVFYGFYPDTTAFPDASGRVAVFESTAADLVAGDTNGARDVFLRDLETGEVRRVSVSATGEQGNGDSYGASLSADGRYVCFVSSADNLVPEDTRGDYDVFVKDLVTNSVRLVTDTGENSNKAVMSADGNVVAYGQSIWQLVPVADFERPNYNNPIHVVNLETGARTTIANDDWYYGENFAFSGNGRFLAVGRQSSIELVDTVTGAMSLVSNTAGWIGNLSHDGRYIAYTAEGNVWLYDTLGQGRQLISADQAGHALAGRAWRPTVSADGSRVVFNSAPMVSNGFYEVPGDDTVYLKEVRTGELTLLVPPKTEFRHDSTAHLSPDGRSVIVKTEVLRIEAEQYLFERIELAEPPPLRGDVDRNGVVDPQDAVWSVWLINRYQGPLTGDLPEEAAALDIDLTGDGAFDPQDVLHTLLAVNQTLNPTGVFQYPGPLGPFLPALPSPDDAVNFLLASDLAETARKKARGEF